MAETQKELREKSPKIAVEMSQWDLGALFKDEAALERCLKQSLKRAKAFAKSYEGALDKLEVAGFAAAFKEYEEILEALGRIGTYTFLRFAKDTREGDLYAKYEMQTNAAQNLVLFFELELCKIPKEKQKQVMAANPRYAYFFQKLIEQDKYQLSLEQERVLLATSPVGVGAFSRLFDEHLSALRFPSPLAKLEPKKPKNILESKLKNAKNKYKAKQKKSEKISQKISEEEILSLMHSPERNVRKLAAKIFTKKLKKSRHLLGYILNMVRKDLKISKELRGYERPESFRHLSNGATQKSVDKLFSVVCEHYHIVEDYYTLKAKLLGIKKLKSYDRYAPLPCSHNDMSYDEALKMTLKAFGDFSKEFRAIAQKALKKGWVDSHPQPNKRGGAFSHGAVPGAHPYVLLNFTNSRRDAFTIAHEFGHMIHQELSKSQGYLNMDTPLTTAETASVFAEMLLFDSMKKTLSKEELIPLYAGKLEDIFSTLFRQIAMSCFERRIHDLDSELKPKDFDRIWREENEKMFGTSLELDKNYNSWWCYIPHFVHSPFYCYAYSYGQLLVLALFGLYKSQTTPKEREKFIQKYTHFLSLGGSKSPKELISAFGLNLESDRFWLIGMGEVEKMLQEFKELISE